MVTQQSAQEVALEVLDLSVSAHASGTGVMITVDQARTLCNAVLAGQEAVAAERERCARIVDVPLNVEPWEVIGGQEGIAMLRVLAKDIRAGTNYPPTQGTHAAEPRKD